MGHEIAHVAARHGTRNATKGDLAQFAAIPLILLGPGGMGGVRILRGSQLRDPAWLPEVFAGINEREADYLGLQYMYKAGYDPNAFVSFFEKIRSRREAASRHHPQVFLHPSAYARPRRKSQEEIATSFQHATSTLLRTSEFDLVKIRLSRIENRQQASGQKGYCEQTYFAYENRAA